MKIKLYIVAFPLAILLAGGAYFAYVHQPSKVAKTNPILDGEALSNHAENKQRHKQEITDLKDKIATMRVRQEKRDIQMQAYLESARAPQKVPDLPIITPLEVPSSSVNRTRIQAQLSADAGDSLPKPVMEKFTAETGLTQTEIDNAMNR